MHALLFASGIHRNGTWVTNCHYASNQVMLFKNNVGDLKNRLIEAIRALRKLSAALKHMIQGSNLPTSTSEFANKALQN